ncbi:hypothetical protein [Massilia sp. H6]|uniref:hypothetical protein n=1 Tax=Massilia sp. H6 TaxID=2970464 RepID=UPI002169C0BC|nr:hypothetical protein [Massilia sp. H6]UVW29746.1 hypothetical protein NRS07_06355 [Massilia sp. H6]
MAHAEKKAKEEGVEFARFTLKDMRPAAVTDRVEDGDETITNATGHSSDRMVRKVYDRRKTKVARYGVTSSDRSVAAPPVLLGGAEVAAVHLEVESGLDHFVNLLRRVYKA